MYSIIYRPFGCEYSGGEYPFAPNKTPIRFDAWRDAAKCLISLPAYKGSVKGTFAIYKDWKY